MNISCCLSRLGINQAQRRALAFVFCIKLLLTHLLIKTDALCPRQAAILRYQLTSR